MLNEMTTRCILAMGRKVNKKKDLSKEGNSYDGNVFPKETTIADKDANLVSSLLPNGNHAPAIDIDLPVYLVASSTPGNFHLYFEKEMTWKQYERLLHAMYEAGLVERGFYEQAVRFRQSYLRLPGIKKEGTDEHEYLKVDDPY